MHSDITRQVFWAATGEVLDRSKYDPALLKTYYVELQHKAKQRKQQIYFIVDGIDELAPEVRDIVLQHLGDILPLGIPQFRFLFAGDETLYRGLLNSRLIMKSFPLTEFSTDDTRALFASVDMELDTLREMNSICRGMPGRLTSALRAIEKGTKPADFISDGPSKWPEFFEIDWKQVDPANTELNRILALLAHDSKPHTVKDVSEALNISEIAVCSQLANINFVVVDKHNGNVTFVTSGLRQYAADRLKSRKAGVQKLLIKRLLTYPQSDETILNLPEYMEEAGQYADLLNLLTPDHIIQVLERTQTLSRVDDTVKRGLRGARNLGRDADILRFSLQQSVISDLAAANGWESEVAALAALNRDAEALALANNAILREDRLQMLATLAHHIWLRGDVVPPEHIDQIKLLIDNLDFWSLGQRAEHIASQLTCVSPDLATSVLTKAKRGIDDDGIDRAFARFTVSTLRELKDEQRLGNVIDAVVSARQSMKGRGLLEGVRVLSGKFTPTEVCARADEISKPNARIAVLRYWCVLNGGLPQANLVALHALSLAVATASSRLDADLLADLSQALPGATTEDEKRELIGMLDGVRATAERLGPSVDYVRLQLALAGSEAGFDVVSAEGRLLELVDYVAAITDLPTKGQAYAQLLGSLRSLPPGVNLLSGKTLEDSCAKELEEVVLVLSESTADHYLALGGIIAALAPGDLQKALDYTRIVNTEGRRDAVLVDVIDVLLRRSSSKLDPNALQAVTEAIISEYDRDEALGAIMARFSDETTLSGTQLASLIPIMEKLPTITDSMIACRAIVRALRLLNLDMSESYASLRHRFSDVLSKRWSCMDVGWARVDAGYGIARDIAGFSSPDAEKIFAETDEIRKDWQISVRSGASTYIACIRLLICIYSGLLPRKIDQPADVQAFASLIDILPSYGERAALWADLSMRALLAGRADISSSITNTHLYPAFCKISKEDSAYRAGVLIRISPALYKAQPASCLEELQSLGLDDRDAALLQIIRFLLWNRVPTDPIENGLHTIGATSYEILLQVEQLSHRINTDWMLYSIVEDVADSVNHANDRYTLTKPQREDISRRFSDIAKAKLPSMRHITHKGFRIATLAQAVRMSQTKPSDWTDLIRQAETLDNVSDKSFVLQIIALCLPKSMDSEKTRLLDISENEIVAIPWHFDQIERLLGLADQLHGKDTQRCRKLLSRAAQTISQSPGDVREQRRHLVDIAYRVDEEYAKQLIDTFDDDDVKKRAQAQVRLLEVRRTITEVEGKTDQEQLLAQVRGSEIHKLGQLLLKGLNSGRIQHFHPTEIRHYMAMAAEQPLKRAFPILNWYIGNAVSRYANNDQAVTFLRPLFEACVVGTQLAGRISGKSLIRLKALKQKSTQLSNSQSLLITPESKDVAMQVLGHWFEKNLGNAVTIHDPYFGPDDLSWLQLIRSSNPKCVITVMTARANQPKLPAGSALEDMYVEAWRRLYDQAPPEAEIVIIGGEHNKKSPIHDRWLVSGGMGLRFGSSLNGLGTSKDSEISEMSPRDVEQKRTEIDSYLSREKSEYLGEKLRLSRFWL